MPSKEELQSALDDLWKRYGNTLSMLNDALDKLESKPKEVIKEIEKIVEVPVEKIVEKKVPVEKIVEKEVVVEKEVPVEKIVEKIVEVVDNAKVEQLTKDNLALKSKILELEKTYKREVVMPLSSQQEKMYIDKINQLTEQLKKKPEVVERESSKDLKRAAKLMAKSEANKEGYTEDEILELLNKSDQDIVNKQLGFWAVPLPTGDTDDNTSKRYLKK